MTEHTQVVYLPTLAVFKWLCGCEYRKLLRVGRAFRVSRVKHCPDTGCKTPLRLINEFEKVEWDAFAQSLRQSFGGQAA